MKASYFHRPCKLKGTETEKRGQNEKEKETILKRNDISMDSKKFTLFLSILIMYPRVSTYSIYNV